jgi:hypothetical protein
MSWSATMGMTPRPLTRPTVGLMPTSMFALAGLRIEPDVSVPMFAAQRLAAVPMPELDPPVASAGRPSLNGAVVRGSTRGSYGLKPKPPTAL